MNYAQAAIELIAEGHEPEAAPAEWLKAWAPETQAIADGLAYINVGDEPVAILSLKAGGRMACDSFGHDIAF